jgi:hypothetical protein
MKKTLLWRAMFLAAILSSVMSVEASPFEEEAQENQGTLSVQDERAIVKEIKKRKREPSKRASTRKVRKQNLDTHLVLSDVEQITTHTENSASSLGAFEDLPVEVITHIFSYLKNPLMMRTVSPGTKDIVETYFSLKMPVSRVTSFAGKRREDPIFLKNLRISFEGWVNNPQAILTYFPQGTIFKGGDARFYKSDPLPLLPVGLKGTMVVETNEEKKAFFAKGVEQEINILSLAEEWQKFLSAPFMTALGPLEREAVLVYQNSLMFLLGLANGQDMLELFIGKCLEKRTISFEADIDYLAKLSRALGRFGSTKEKLSFFSMIQPRVFDKDVSLNVMGAALENIANYPDQTTRLQLISKLQPFMTRLDAFFYFGDLEDTDQSLLQLMLPLLSSDLFQNELMLLQKLNIKQLSKSVGRSSWFFTVVGVLSKLEESERAVQLSRLLTYDFVSAFAERRTFPGGWSETYHASALEGALKGLAELKTQKTRKAVISLLGSQKIINRNIFPAFFQDVARDSFFADLVHNLDLKSLSQICKNHKATLSVLKGLAALQDEKLSKALVRTLRVSFVEAFRHKNDHLSHENQLVCFGDLQGAVTELGRVEPALRSRISSLITMDFLNRLYAGEGDGEKGALAMRVAQALFMIEDQTTRDHLYNALTPSFFKAIASHEALKLDALNQVISALAKIQGPDIRGRAITLLGDQADAQMQGPISAIDFLEMLVSKADEDLQKVYLYLYK